MEKKNLNNLNENPFESHCLIYFNNDVLKVFFHITWFVNKPILNQHWKPSNESFSLIFQLPNGQLLILEISKVQNKLNTWSSGLHPHFVVVFKQTTILQIKNKKTWL